MKQPGLKQDIVQFAPTFSAILTFFLFNAAALLDDDDDMDDSDMFLLV